MLLTRQNLKKQLRQLIGPGKTYTDRGVRTQYFDLDEVPRVKEELDQAATLVDEKQIDDATMFDYETSDGKEFRLFYSPNTAYIDHSYMDEYEEGTAERTAAQLQESRTLQDEVEEFIVTMLDQGFTKSEIIEEIPEVFEGFDIGLASDAYEDYERDIDPSNEEATVGDIERFVDEMEMEGFPRDEAIEKAMKRYKLSAREIENMIESTSSHPAQQALDYLENLESTLGRVVEADYGDRLSDLEQRRDPDGIEDEDCPLTTEQVIEMMKALVHEDDWDEEDAATYIVETEMDFDSEEEEIDLIGQVIDTFYDEMYSK